MRASLIRTLLAGSLLATTLGSCRFEGDKPPPAVVNPSPRAAQSGRAELPALLKRPALSEPKTQLFEPPTVELPKPAPPVVEPVAARATAPPYRFVGRVEQDGKSEFVLMKGSEAVPVVVGQILDAAYRVEAIDGYEVSLLHLPSKQIVVVTSRSPEQGAVAATAGVRARLSWDGPASVKSKAAFSIALRVSSAEPVRESAMQLRFDPTVLESIEVQPGKHYEAGGVSHRVDEGGRIDIKASRASAAPATEAELVVLTFHAVRAVAAAEVFVEDLALRGTAGQVIPLDGFIPFRTAIGP